MNAPRFVSSPSFVGQFLCSNSARGANVSICRASRHCCPRHAMSRHETARVNQPATMVVSASQAKMRRCDLEPKASPAITPKNDRTTAAATNLKIQTRSANSAAEAGEGGVEDSKLARAKFTNSSNRQSTKAHTPIAARDAI